MWFMYMYSAKPTGCKVQLKSKYGVWIYVRMLQIKHTCIVYYTIVLVDIISVFFYPWSFECSRRQITSKNTIMCFMDLGEKKIHDLILKFAYTPSILRP